MLDINIVKKGRTPTKLKRVPKSLQRLLPLLVGQNLLVYSPEELAQALLLPITYEHLSVSNLKKLEQYLQKHGYEKWW